MLMNLFTGGGRSFLRRMLVLRRWAGDNNGDDVEPVAMNTMEILEERRTMDTAVHAQLMANLCTPQYGQLILQVAKLRGEDADLSRRLIALIAHADKMAAICDADVAKAMIYSIAEKAFRTARADAFGYQSDGANIVIAMVAHAHAMGSTTREVCDDMFNAVRPMVDQALPTQREELDALKNRRSSIGAEISRIAHEALMKRMLRSM